MKRKLYTVANAHLDTQWNWDIRDTIRDCIKNTLDVNFALIEKYPSYRFNFEGAFRYKLAKEYYPRKYEKLKEYAKAGRWNVAGSSWDACDTNIPSSEGLMRQILYGNGFWEKELGQRSEDIFLPDCFGFRFALPSIAHHMGLRGFSTQKLVWGVGTPRKQEDGSLTRPVPDSESDRPQTDLCKWVGPDGNFIIASLDEGGYTYNFEYSGDTPVNRRPEFLAGIQRNERLVGVSARSMYYGAGDYGGGPTDAGVKLLCDAIDDGDNGMYLVISAASDDIFKDLTPEEIENMPAYRGNLLIPHGYGAMVSHTVSKRWNRKNELLADSAERAASIAKWLGTAEYPKERLTDAWHTFLWHQFHDDVTGTSCGTAYEFSYNDYVIALNTFASELTASVAAIAASLDTAVSGRAAAVFNEASFRRSDIVTFSSESEAPFLRVFDACGNEIPSQCTKSGDIITVLFAPSVEPVSVTVFSLRDSDTPCTLRTSLRVTGNTLENRRYTVKLNGNGDVCSIIDRENGGRELLSAPVSMELIPDTILVEYPAWEYNYEDFSASPDPVMAKPEIKITQNGPAAVALTVTRTFRGSVYKQTVTLWEGGDRVDFDNHVEWATRCAMLRAVFPTTASNETALFDLGLGAEENGNSNSYPYFQYNVHQWADLSDRDGQFGVSVLNDCKYSMDKPDEHTLRLTLIRTPRGAYNQFAGQSCQDFGTNLFRFSIFGHGASRAGVAQAGEACNQPLYAFAVPRHEGDGSAVSLLSCDREEVLVRCIKEEEKGSRMIIRVQETGGKPLDSVCLNFMSPPENVIETDGYETELAPVNTDGNRLRFSMSPYQVRTFAVTLPAPRFAEKAEPMTELALPFNRRVTTSNLNRGEYEFANGISIPSELLPERIRSGGVPFAFGKSDADNAVVCSGQVLELPYGTQELCLLAASADGDRSAVFDADGKSLTVPVPDFHDFIGTWDQITTGRICMVKQEELGYNFTHTHDKNGDRLYLFANLFLLRLKVNGAKRLRLPCDANIIIMAATADRAGMSASAAAPLYDTTPDKKYVLHRLTVIGGTGSGERVENTPAYILATPTPDQIFIGWEGENLENPAALYTTVMIGDRDVTVRAKYLDISGNVLIDAAVTANHSMNADELPEKVLIPDDRGKWCGQTEPDGSCYLDFTLPQERTVGAWYTHHAGVRESRDQNSVDFSLLYRDTDAGEWKVADAVTDNRESAVYRTFTPITARFFRLLITKATRDGDDHARIYQCRLLP